MSRGSCFDRHGGRVWAEAAVYLQLIASFMMVITGRRGLAMFREFLFHPLILAGLLAAGCSSASALSAKVTVSPEGGGLRGTVTIRDLAAHAAAAPAARASAGMPVEMPRPRLPNGSPASKQSTLSS
jgi:hypothetical protein